ncbi:hypothetical protein HYDPIDRAFT_167104 [Hydnomerulius pinastri MD-312]|nr:hypothetical protein HYDPIDRAFT_167104 [Hydnomerulius pinastri MD-312]
MVVASHYYDVIVVGGSTAGCATALSIFRTNPNASILVLDNADASAFKIGESLPAAAKQVLSYLSPELLKQVSESARSTADGVYVRCSGNASCWGSPKLEETHAMMNPFGAGWHLDRALFDQMLRETLETCSSISLVKSTFLDINVAADDDTRWTMSASDLAGGDVKIYSAKWVVDATGRKATVARKLGSQVVKEDHLLAFYAIFARPSMNEDGDYRTIIEASESGWWYSSPLPRNRRVVAYHTDDSDPSSRVARTLDGFMNLLHDATTHISQLISEREYDIDVESNTRFPVCTAAGSSHLEPPCPTAGTAGARWCAVGDAAMAFDPLSSQGMITALKMGCVVGNVIAKELITMEPTHNPMAIIPSIYSQVWSKYVGEKSYYYNQGRFDGDFWRARR